MEIVFNIAYKLVNDKLYDKSLNNGKLFKFKQWI